jgi:polysaccharide export outer membrane protein
MRLPKLRFSLNSLFILILGIAIGFALNVRTLQLLTGLVANEAFMGSLPPYTIGPPDILEVRVFGKGSDAIPSISGQHLVAPDGTVNLGACGQVSVAGKTLDEARDAIEKAVAQGGESTSVLVGVYAYNSKAYYVVTQDEDTEESVVVRVPITGNETALDAIAHMGGLKALHSTKVWIARPALHGVGSEKLLNIDWDQITHNGSAVDNYRLLPNDRVIISRKSTSTATN